MDAPSQVFDEIQRRLVGPVDVFDDQDGWRARQIIENGGEEQWAVRLAIEERAERRRRLLRDVVEGTEWARGEERLTGAPQNARVSRRVARRSVRRGRSCRCRPRR